MGRELAVAVGALVSMVALIVAHIGLWPFHATLHRVANYTIGTAILLAGFTVTCGLLDAWFFAVAAWTMAGAGGIVIACAWWVRGLQKAPRALDARRALEERHGAPRGSDARAD